MTTGRVTVRPTRRSLLAGAGASLLAPGIAGASTFHSRATRRPAFGVPSVFLREQQAALLIDYLSDALGRDVEIVPREAYSDLVALLVAGMIDAAWTGGLSYALFRERLELLAIPIYLGSPTHWSCLIVREDRPANEWLDLAGDFHAFADPRSNCGYLATVHLLKTHGRDLSFFSHSFFAHSHYNVIRAVEAGLAMSGSVNSYVWEGLQEIDQAVGSRTRIVHRSGPLGFPPVVARRSSSRDALGQELAEAFRGMRDSASGQNLLTALRLDEFAAPGDGKLYAEARRNWVADQLPG